MCCAPGTHRCAVCCRSVGETLDDARCWEITCTTQHVLFTTQGLGNEIAIVNKHHPLKNSDKAQQRKNVIETHYDSGPDS